MEGWQTRRLDKIRTSIDDREEYYKKTKEKYTKESREFKQRKEIEKKGVELCEKKGCDNLATKTFIVLGGKVKGQEFYWLRYSTSLKRWAWSKSGGVCLKPITLASKKEATKLRKELNNERNG